MPKTSLMAAILMGFFWGAPMVQAQTLEGGGRTRAAMSADGRLRPDRTPTLMNEPASTTKATHKPDFFDMLADLGYGLAGGLTATAALCLVTTFAGTDTWRAQG